MNNRTEEVDMMRQEEAMKKMNVCHSCGINRDDCKLNFEGLMICATCEWGHMPKSEECKKKKHAACKTEACYCSCHPENNEMGNDQKS